MSRRGPYKQYLKDLSIPIPDRTLRRRLQIINQHYIVHEHALLENDNSQRIDDESMDWDPINGYFDSRENSDCSSNNEEEFDQQSLEQYEEGLCSTMEKRDHDNCEENSEKGTIGINYDLFSDTDSEDNDNNNTSENDNDNVFTDFVDISGDKIQGENFEHINLDRKVLYEGCDITKEESELLIMSYAMRFGLSDIALQSLIDLIDCHLPRQEHKSLHLLKKKFPQPPNIITHFFCSGCKNIINFLGVSQITCSCGLECVMSDLKRQQCFFIYIPLQDQLVRLLQDNRVHSMIQEGFTNSQSDVHCGRIYKKLVHDDVISINDLTLQWNTDGVQIFKSSKVCLWPIQVAINNLPFKIRKENILLCGLWYGSSKPEMNTFLKPFVEELTMLHNEGLEYVIPGSEVKAKIKIHTLIASVDSQARPLLQNLKTFRGKQGCSFCLNEGEECEVGRGKARIYRGDIEHLRTHEQHVQDTKIVMQTGKVKNGIKGASILLLLPLFNIITSFVPDYMHCVLLGVVKTMVVWWTDGINKKESFYIGSKKLKEIDAILCSIKPPSEITRTPRSITEYKLWKASEWKNFLLYYSLPCLQSVGMPKKYVDHWLLLVCSMHIFLLEKISRENFSIAEKCIKQFVLNMEDIYNAPQLMKFNVHLLLHIPKSVKEFGGLWAVSCFSYEHYNGILAKMFRNSQAVPQQICKFYLRFQSIKEKGADVFSSNNNTLYAKFLYEAFTFKKLSSSYCTAYGDHVRLFGKPDHITLTLTQKVAVENLLMEQIHQQVNLFHRVIYKNILIHVEGYERMIKRVNNIVRLQDETVVSVSHALVVTTLRSNNIKCILLGKRLHLTNEIICRNPSVNVSSDIICSIMEMTPECVAIYPQMIQCKCIVISYNRKLCVYSLVNSLERD